MLAREKSFLFGMVFSNCKIVQVACQIHSWFVYAPESKHTNYVQPTNQIL